MDKLRFQSFASGSSGNCYFIGNASCGILIDAGIGVRTIRKNLKAMGLDFPNIWGVFVTHSHSDHIRAIGSLGEIHHVPVYTTREIHEGINKSYCVTEKLNGSRRYLVKEETFRIGDFAITPFEVSHDAIDNVGYTVEYKGKRVTFATDLGYVCENADKHLRQANVMIFEANYDEHMLDHGPYPADLKRRIKSNTGHLSNKQTADYLAEIYHDGLEKIFLCHLSKENNHPGIAFNTVEKKLTEKGVKIGEDVELYTLERFTPTRMFLLN